jgi:hypothetical protein
MFTELHACWGENGLRTGVEIYHYENMAELREAHPVPEVAAQARQSSEAARKEGYQERPPLEHK